MPELLRRLSVSILLLMAALAPALAEPVTLNGITFSDELGGFAIVAGSGSGAPDDPFVIVERIVANEPAVLVIRGLTPAFGNPVRTNHYVGFALTKVVLNATGRAWRSFGVELETRLGERSGYLDGLSFGQERDAARVISADRYARAEVIDEPADGVRFTGGTVRPGERVVIRLIVTDNTPRPEFYLAQLRPEPMAGAPVPGRLAAANDRALVPPPPPGQNGPPVTRSTRFGGQR
jgi:hypothetical protein